jgi:hypothetical protein
MDLEDEIAEQDMEVRKALALDVRMLGHVRRIVMICFTESGTARACES